ncbi:MAG: dihydrolipoyl dehydrogenase [Deltaproteobacteria bacterium]|nr:dihydrolipoyl dehydrogenase [Deltaproteobacteria bacterium]
MSELTKFDVIVIGAGPGGYVGAIRAAQLGFSVACVEDRTSLGGTCLNVGCIPSKAMLESSHRYHQVQHELADHGIEVGKVSLDLKKMINRKNSVVTAITKGVEFLFKKNKITWLRGWGKVESAHSVSVQSRNGEKKTYEAKHIIIASGSVPIELPFAPFDHKLIVDSTDALEFSRVPEHLIVVGAGVIGLELGSVWSRLGARVTFIEALPNILGNTDSELSTTMLRLFQKQGITFHMESMLKSVDTKNKVIARCTGKAEGTEIVGDKILIAIGRKPAILGLGLENVGVKMEKNGWLTVDDRFRSSVPSICAIGDAVRGPMLAHKAEEEGIAVAEFLAGKHGHVNYEAIPNVVYTWPEIATVGQSEEDLKSKGIAYRTGKFNFKANGRARAVGAVDGFVKILADAQTDRLLGVHILGPMASELIAEVAVAFEFGASAEDVARSVHAHPTLAEVIKEAALDVDKRAIHS